MDDFNIITEADIVQIKGPRKWIQGKRELTIGEIENLKADAELIEKTKLWQLMIKESRFHAQKKALMDAKDYEELGHARVLLNLTIFFEKFIQNIKNK